MNYNLTYDNISLSKVKIYFLYTRYKLFGAVAFFRLFLNPAGGVISGPTTGILLRLFL